MNDTEYQKQFSAREDKVIAIDFDGVIHNHHLGFHDGTIYGTPVPGSLEALKQLHDMDYTIVIHSCKLHPDRPLVTTKLEKSWCANGWSVKVLPSTCQMLYGENHMLWLM